MPITKRSSISLWRYTKRGFKPTFVISSEILMLYLLKSLWKRKHVVKVLHILPAETLTPEIFKESILKNTENQRPTSKKNSPLGIKFYFSLDSCFKHFVLDDSRCITNLSPYVYCIYELLVTWETYLLRVQKQPFRDVLQNRCS